MKIYKIWLFFLIVGIFSHEQAMAEKPKVATVDMQELFKQYHRTSTAQKYYNGEYARIQKAVDERGEQIKKMRIAVQAIATELKKEGLSNEEKMTKQQEGQLIAQEIKIAERNIEIFKGQERAKVAQKKAASMKGIMEDIRKNVVTMSENMKYDYVFDRSGMNTNQVSFFLYLKDATDITSAMLKELNKFAPGAGSE